MWKRIKINPLTNCWEWLGAKSNGYGIGRFQGKKHRVHRISYNLFMGTIPKEKELDHKCGNKSCVNPEHLEPVKHKENVFRSDKSPTTINLKKTHCKRGHLLSEGNLCKTKGEERRCKICKRSRSRQERAENPEKTRLYSKIYQRNRRAKLKIKNV